MENVIEGKETVNPASPVDSGNVPETPQITPVWEVIANIGDRLGPLESSDPRIKEIRELIYKAAELAKGI